MGGSIGLHCATLSLREVSSAASSCSPSPRVSFTTNGAVAPAAGDSVPALSDGACDAVATGLDAIRAAFVDVVGDGARADQLLALYQGLLVLIRFGRPRPALQAVTDAAGKLATP